MKLFAGGTRGTRVMTEAAFSEFGGDTTSFLVTGAGGERVIVDAGTGLRNVQAQLGPATGMPFYMLLTHYHLDHLSGLPHFGPLYRENAIVNIRAPVLESFEPEAVLARLLDPPLWPVPIKSLSASVRIDSFSPTEPAAQTLGDLTYRWCPVRHPGGCLAYRFDEESTGHSLVIATDMEWDLASTAEREAFLQFCRSPRPVDLLLVDGHFTPENYEPFRGWGHSRWSDAVEIASLADAGTLRVIHHAPESADDVLARNEQELRAREPRAFLLRQGDEIDLADRGGPSA